MTLALSLAARRWPERPALIEEGASLTYAELQRRSAGLARALSTLGALGEPARPVALVVHHELSTLIAIHALVAVGAPFVPLHPRLTPVERARILELSAASQVLDLHDRPQLISQHVALAPPAELPPLPDDERPLAFIPSSGSTGQPRLVVLSRRAFAASARSSEQRLGWRDDDRWLASLPLSHVGGLSVLTRCLDAGRCAVLVPPGDTERIISALHERRVTLASLVPAQLARLLERSPRFDPPPWVRALLVGGARTPERLLVAAAERSWPVLTTYGMTETCSQVATQRPSTVNRGELGAGPPLDGVEIRARGGVIEIRGPTLLSAVIPAAGAALDPDGWFRTDDLGELDAEGNLHVLGRASEVIVTGGEKVPPAEVERVLERCEGVLEVCAFGVPHATWGEMVVVAVVGSAPPARLRACMEAELAPFKRARAVALLTSLPRLPSGKLDRVQTAELARGRLEPLTP